MDAAIIAGLVKAQAPEHAEHRAQELKSYDVTTRVAVINCACGVDLNVVVPRPVTDKVEAKQEHKHPSTKGVGDGASQ